MLCYALLLIVFLLTTSVNGQTQNKLETTDASHKALAANERGLKAALKRDFTTSEREHANAVAIYRSLGSGYYPHLAIALFNLAQAKCGQGKWREGEEILEESLLLSRSSLGPEHIETSAALNALGHIETLLGDLKAAGDHFAESLELTRAHNPISAQHAFALAGFSTLRLRAGKPDEALPYADEALRVMIEADPGEGLESAVLYQNVGRIHRAAGRSERALPLFRKARDLYERVGAQGDPRYATLLSEEGLALMDDGRTAMAEAEMKRAVGMLEPCGGCQFELAVARNNLGLLRFQQKKYSEADDLLRKALAAEETFGPANSTEIGTTKSILLQVRTALHQGCPVCG
jgi:tetratricopeptide (TPR) repeat protein